jgi:hypothetical protein
MREMEAMELNPTIIIVIAGIVVVAAILVTVGLFLEFGRSQASRQSGQSQTGGVSQQTDTQLTIRTRGAAIIAIFVGIVFMVVPAFFIYAGLRETSLATREELGLGASVDLIFAGVFFCLGLFVLLIFGLGQFFTTWTFDKPLGVLTIEKRGLLGREKKEYSLNEIMGVQLDTMQDSDGDTMYRVLLRTVTGDEPLTTFYSSGRRGNGKTVKQIRTFLNL